MSSKARSITREIRREIRRRGGIAGFDGCPSEVLIENNSSELRLCPKCRATRSRLLASDDAAAANELQAPQESDN